MVSTRFFSLSYLGSHAHQHFPVLSIARSKSTIINHHHLKHSTLARFLYRIANARSANIHTLARSLASSFARWLVCCLLSQHSDCRMVAMSLLAAATDMITTTITTTTTSTTTNHTTKNAYNTLKSNCKYHFYH